MLGGFKGDIREIGGVAVQGGIYGGIRNWIANTAPIKWLASKLPFGQYNDEAAMAIANYGAYKVVAPARGVAKLGIGVETAMVTSQMVASKSSSTSSASTRTGWR